jgi:hypothetical protein
MKRIAVILTLTAALVALPAGGAFAVVYVPPSPPATTTTQQLTTEALNDENATASPAPSAQADAPTAQKPESHQSTTVSAANYSWLWFVGGAVILAILLALFFILRRRGATP